MTQFYVKSSFIQFNTYNIHSLTISKASNSLTISSVHASSSDETTSSVNFFSSGLAVAIMIDMSELFDADDNENSAPSELFVAFELLLPVFCCSFWVSLLPKPLVE